MTVAVRDVEFAGERSALRGRLYAHDEPRPAVVMAHGFSATAVGMAADRYAEVLADAGLAVLLYDHEGFGASDGEPRGVVNRWLQCRGFRHALDFAATQRDVLPDGLALWGDSFSASVAITVAAYDERVAALVVQVPSCGSTLGDGDPDGRAYAYFGDLLREGDVTGALGDELPVVSPDQAAVRSHLVPITAYRWFTEYGHRPGSTWRGSVRRGGPATRFSYTTDVVVGHLRCPSLWLIARDDEMPGSQTAVAVRCFELAGGAKERRMIAGGHFGLLYEDGPEFAAASRAQADFLVRTLVDTRP